MHLKNRTRTNRHVCSRPRCFHAASLGTLSVLIASGSALAGLVGGGVTHTFTGGVSGNWNTPANWNTGQVPGLDQSAIVTGGPFAVVLNSNTFNLRSAYVGSGRTLSTNGFALTATNGIGTVTVNGASSTLAVPATAISFALATKDLKVENNGRLQMQDGSALVNNQLTMSSNGRITGNGIIDVSSPLAAAFNGFNGSDITVAGGTLRIRMFNGGTIAPPPVINITNPGTSLLFTGAFMLPVGDLNIGGNSTFSSANNWTLGGTLNATGGAGTVSNVAGNGSATVDGDVVVASNSHLRFDTSANFESTADVNIQGGATMELTEISTSDAGHSTTINLNGRLLLNAPISANGWDGNIVSNAGIIESNSAFGLRVDGALTLGSILGVRTTIGGTSTVIINGTASAPGLGAIVNSTLELSAASNTTLGRNAVLTVNGDMIARANSTISGNGMVSVQSGGELLVVQDANFGVDIANAGDIRLGVGSNQNAIDVNGTFAQTASGRMLVDIGGAGEAQRDFLQVNDDATIGGTLHLSLVNGFTPEIGAQFEVLGANNVAGTFDSLTGAPGFSVSYTANSVLVTYDGVWPLGDVNHDGFVNVTDLLMVISAWGAGGVNPADVNNDGIVNVTDLLIVISNWS